MKKFYCFSHTFKRSCIEILPDRKIEGDFLSTYLDAGLPSSKNRLPESLVFHIAACKKEYDIIGTHNCWTVIFFSDNLISILKQFTDMTDKCYRINLPGVDKEYYNIYNLSTYPRINRREVDAYPSILSEWPPVRFVLGKEDLGPIFSASTTAWIIVSEEIMKAMKKAKLTNIEFEEAYGYTPEEALEWAQANPEFADDFADKPWFKKLLDK